ncbi:hypothetical protein H2200_003480 [Cladophialophora chaetospira]|uniref:Uncharacterized protein n=1 Tax=Cladophialophora chaetospira TaxID=386627 RepID=A0AA38XHF2_9EURO|nr:hypothetical protein H2200_003480 [Cladophialophora chaetospira]
MASADSNAVPLVIASVNEVSGDDWTGISDQKRRKQLQNRLNQRAYSSEASLNEKWFHRILTVPIMRNAVIIGTCMDIELLTGRRYSSTISKAVVELSREVRKLVSQLSIETYSDISSERQRSRPNNLTVSQRRVSAVAFAAPAYVDDDLIFAVMHLVKASTIGLLSDGVQLDIIAGTFGLFTPPMFLQRLQGLHLWGRSCPYQAQGKVPDAQATQHLVALEHLVSLKGGLRKIKAPGFAAALHQFDVIHCAKRLNPPKFELPERSVRLSKHVEWLRHSCPRRVGLCGLENTPRGLSLLESLEDLHILCCWITSVLDRENQHVSAGSQGVIFPSMPSTEDLTTLRTLIEHRLLSFVPDPDDRFELLAHTAAMIFMHGVVFPLPNRSPMQMLIQRLVDGFQDLQLHLRELEEQRFLLWVLMMGAMATSDAEAERLFFVERLAVLIGQVGISSWEDLKTVLSGYLWVDWGCDAGAKAVWRMMFQA